MNNARVERHGRFHPHSALLAAAAVEFQSAPCLIVDKASTRRIAERAQVDTDTVLRYFETGGLQELDEHLRRRGGQAESGQDVGGRMASRRPDESADDFGGHWDDPGESAEPTPREYGAWALWRLDHIVVEWFAGRSLGLLQKSLGLVFLWFGALKLFPGVSPAEGLVRLTIAELFELVGVGVGAPTTAILLMLALWEVLIGLGFLLDRHRRAVTWMLIAHMPGTALPLLLLPAHVWTRFPHQLTLEGQYIIKNLVLLAGGFVIGATVRGGSLISSRYVEVDDEQSEDRMDQANQPGSHLGN